MEKAQNAAAKATEALKAGDGDEAKVHAAEADAALSMLEGQLTNHADHGEIDEDTAATIGEKLDVARGGIATVKDSDLSLLGDESIGDDSKGADIGGPDGDKKPAKDAGDIGADEPKTDAPKADAPDAAAENKAKSDARGDAPEGGNKVDLADMPAPLQAAFEGGEDEEYFESTKWPGTYEARYTDENGETYVVSVGDAEGNAVGTTSGGGNPYMIYNADGSTSNETWTDLDSAVQNLPGYDGGGSDAPDAPDAGDGAPSVKPGGGLNPDSGYDDPNMEPPDPADGAGTPDAPAAPQGSTQQQAGNKAVDTLDNLSATLMNVADGEGLDDEQLNQIGGSLDEFGDALDTLNAGIQDGSYNANDLTAAQDSLSRLEASLMAAADGPGLSDEDANTIGQALDDMFADLGTLAQSLEGNAEPPPFAARKYVRQWLGRRGLRLGTFNRQGR